MKANIFKKLMVLVGVLALFAVPMNFAQDTVEEDVEDFSYAGIIEDVTETTVTVSSLTFDITSAEIEGEPVVGFFAEVEFYQADGTLFALELEAYEEELEDEEDADDEGDDEDADDEEDVEYEDFGYEGIIEDVTETTVTVSSLTFDITSAEIEGDLVIGFFAEVEFYQADGTLFALELDASEEELEDDDEDADDEDEEDEFECELERPDDWTTYTIQSGDSLFNIALATGTDFEDLLEVNCIENPNVISVGMIIYVENAYVDMDEADEEDEDADESEVEYEHEDGTSEESWECETENGETECEYEYEDEDTSTECEWDDGEWVCETESEEEDD